MRSILAALAALGCVAMLAFSAQAMQAARDALSIWWNSVLPALFPFFVCTGMMEQYGVFDALMRLLWRLFRRNDEVCALLPAALFGAASGYPTGARICGMFKKPVLSVYCNLCSPMFLMGVVALGLAGDVRFFFPVCIGHYGAAAVLYALRRITFGPHEHEYERPSHTETPPAGFLSLAGEGMLAMLRIGGLIVLCNVLGALLEQAGVFALLSRIAEAAGADGGVARALLCGALELTNGCMAAAALPLPPRTLCALYAAIVSFGGLCVFMQAQLFVKLKRPLAYLAGKLCQAVLAAALSFGCAPLFFRADAAVMRVDSESLLSNTLSGLSMLTASLTGVFFMYLIALCIEKSGSRLPDQAIRETVNNPRPRPHPHRR